MSVSPLGFEGFEEVKLPGLEAEEYDAPLGFDADVPLAEMESLNIGFDEDTSAYLKDSGDGPLGDATPTGTSYMLCQAWGGNWVDAEKTPSDTEDDLHCWAAACSNVLAWTGWGVVGGMTNTDQMFQYFQDHWTDQGGLMEFGWDWWFDGTNDSQGWSGWAQVDVAGGGFYPTENFDSYLVSQSNDSLAMSAINTYLHNGYGTTIGIYGPGGHAITVWGYNYNPSNSSDYYGIWVTDSDDSKSIENAPDRLRYYEVEYVGNQWYLQDYYGSNDWYIGLVQGLAQKDPGDPAAPPPAPNEIRGTVYNDVNQDGDKDTGEAFLAGKKVFLDANENGTLDSETINISSGDVPASILDLHTVTSTLSINDSSFSISDVNVTLNISHTYTSDLEVYLIGPDGTRVQLFANVGGSGNNFTNTTLDDQAATSIAGASAPFSGTFRPEGLLSAFNGKSANGVWTLEITDNWTYDQGTLNSWSLQISTGEVQTTTSANGAYAFAGLEDGDYRVQVVAPAGWLTTNPASGYYDVALAGGTVAAGRNFGVSDTVTDLGTVASLRMSNVEIEAGTTWYKCRASHTGFLTVEALSATPGNLVIRLRDANLNTVATSALVSGSQRFNYRATAGTEYYVEVTAVSPQTLTAFRVTNLVYQSGKTVKVFGTAGDDRFVFATGSQHLVQINDVAYRFGASAVTSISFTSGGGQDFATVTGSSKAETFTLRPNALTVTGGGYTLNVSGVFDARAIGASTDRAILYDSAGDDVFVARPTFSTLTGDTYSNRVERFGRVYAFATAGGADTAELYDSAGNDTLVAKPVITYLTGAGFRNEVRRFETVRAYATAGGADVAKMYDSAGNDTFVSHPSESYLSGAGFHNEAHGFRRVYAYSSLGADTAEYHDSAGNDTFVASPTVSYLTGAGFYNRAEKFRYVYAYSTEGGTDTAKMYGRAGNDRFNGYETYAEFLGGCYRRADGFRHVYAYGQGGTDTAYLYDSGGDDTFVATPTVSYMYGDNFYNSAAAFRYVYAVATAGGNDVATLHGSSYSDQFFGYETYAYMQSSIYYYRATGFERVNAHAVRGGTDKAYLYDSAGDDVLDARPTVTSLSGNGFFNQATRFRYVYAYSTAGGADRASLYDSAGNDFFYGYRTNSRLYGGTFYNRAAGFEFVDAYSTVGGVDKAYLFDSVGDDHLEAGPGFTRLDYLESSVSALKFAWVQATSSAGGSDTKTAAAIDFVLKTQGVWTNV
ncbi:MAG: proprotein convertase P-domain-containing protein [Pirellulales bacterium]|nr:proprotein convertase P-domain-containing protein [Pirellulales bacterium]